MYLICGIFFAFDKNTLHLLALPRKALMYWETYSYLSITIVE